MLVISRRIGQSFMIGDDIEATVIDITSGKVVLGLSAPSTVSIKRTEALQAGQFNKAAAASGNINMNGFARAYKAARRSRGPGSSTGSSGDPLTQADNKPPGTSQPPTHHPDS